MEGPEEKKRGIFPSLRRLFKVIAATAENRVELLLVEWHEERLRLVEALLLAGVVLILALMTLMVATFTIVVVCLVTHQIGLVVALGLVYLLATIGCYLLLRKRLKSWAPFAATLAELKKDKECLDEKS
jgi:uncharacterized membrane protein YqjE